MLAEGRTVGPRKAAILLIFCGRKNKNVVFLFVEKDLEIEFCYDDMFLFKLLKLLKSADN